MASIVRFVNAVVASPTTLLDLNQTGGPIMVRAEGIDLSPPPIRRSVVAGFLGVDGDPITATAAGNRTIKMIVQLVNVTAETAATAVQNLSSRLQTDGILMVQLDGMTQPVFFQTYAAPDYVLNMLRLLLAVNTSVTLEIPAMSYGIGPKVTLPAVEVWNDPTKTTTVNSNRYFTVDASGWSGIGGTLIRTTSQFHEGTASGQLTPDGVSSEARAETTPSAAATPGQWWGYSGWIRCAVARSVTVRVRWHGTADAFLSASTGTTISVAANTWTYFAGVALAPTSTTGVRWDATMFSTPPGSNVLFVDEALLFRVNNLANPPYLPGGMTFDVTGVLGDVETPLFLSVAPGLASSPTTQGTRRSALAIRRRGTPSSLAWVSQAEECTLSNQATTQAIDPTAWGPTPDGVTITGGTNNFVRVDFATTSTLAVRLTQTWPTTVFSAETRGTYNVYVRVRHATTTDTFTAQLDWGMAQAYHSGGPVTIPAVSAAANWFLVPLATIQLPPGYDPETDGYSNTAVGAGPVTLYFSFARATGTGTLDIDGILFVPADDRMALIDWHSADNDLSAYIVDGRRTAVYALDSDGLIRDIGGRQIAGAFPMISPGVTNRVYFLRDVGYGTGSTSAAASGTGDSNTAVTTFTPYYFPRYRVVRPAAT